MAGIGTTNDFDISAANGVTTVFTYTFFAYTADQVKVYSVLNDVETPITSGITITPNSNFIGGSVTFSVAPDAAVGEILRRREVPYTQTTEFSDLTRYKETSIERALNALEMQIQQIYSRVSRALKYTEAADTTEPVISTPVDGALLGFDGVTGRIKAVLLASLSLTGLDTVFTGLTAGDSLVYNGTNWINRRLLAAKGTSIASAATTNIGAADSDFIDVTGTTTITSLGATTTRNHVWVNFTGALTLTHNATSLILPGGTNITTAAGDVAEFVRVSGSNWKCVSYIKADGNSVAGVADGSITFAKLASAAIASSAEIIAGTASKIVSAANFTAGLRGLERYTLLATQTASASAQIDFTSFTSSAFNTYIIEFEDVVPVTNGVDLILRTSTDNGGSFASGATDYTRAGRINVSGSTVTTGIGANTSSILVGASLGNVAGNSASGTIKLSNPLGTSTGKLITVECAGANSAGETAHLSGCGRRQSTAAVNAVRLLMSSGNISTGTFRLYGVRNT